jgi:hypothetical protein
MDSVFAQLAIIYLSGHFNVFMQTLIGTDTSIVVPEVVPENILNFQVK